MRVALITTLLAGITGCASPQLVTREIEEPPRMVEVILAHIPVGTPIDDAQHFMEHEGFKCSRQTNAQIPGHEWDYLYCDRHESLGWWVSRRWQVHVGYRDGKVTEVEAHTGLIGP